MNRKAKRIIKEAKQLIETHGWTPYAGYDGPYSISGAVEKVFLNRYTYDERNTALQRIAEVIWGEDMPDSKNLKFYVIWEFNRWFATEEKVLDVLERAA